MSKGHTRKVLGLDDLMATFQALPNRIEDRVLQRALRAGAAVVVREIRKNVNGLELSASGKRKLRRSIKVKRFRNKKGKPVAVAIRMYRYTGKTETTASGREKSADPYWYHWIDQGTAERERRVGTERIYSETTVERGEVWDERAGRWRRATSYTRTRSRAARTAKTGRIKAQPFIEPAIERAKVEAAQRIGDIARELLDRELAKAGKR